MRSTTPHLVFAGGGTAGHLIPGIAVAEYLSRAASKPRITFALTGKSLESRLVTAAGFNYVVIPSRPIPRSPAEAIKFISASFTGYRAAYKCLSSQHVSVVVGLGGYGSVPMARAARRRQIPLVLMEQNVIPGRATRWLSSSAAAVCAAFDEVATHLRDAVHVRTTGNPVRGIAVNDNWQNRFKDPDHVKQIIVLGGSGGSRTLNEQVPRALYKARASIEGWRIIHQTGDRNASSVRELYKKFGLAATVATFFDDVPRMLAETDLAISRAGGTSLAELAVHAVPAILVPYEKSADNHQRLNADVFQAAGAALVTDPREIDGRLDDRLAQVVERLVRNAPLRLQMAESMHDFARPHAARAVAKTIRDVLRLRRLANVA